MKNNNQKQELQEQELLELKEIKKELETAKSVLEIKVKARTRELEELAQDLERQVEERTKELQKKAEELEKMVKSMVGRELKMVGLKKENKELREKIAKYRKNIVTDFGNRQ
jgi:chromosome segregation ATPase